MQSTNNLGDREREDRRANEKVDVSELSLRDLLAMLTLKQLIATISIVAALVGGSLGLGLQLERYRFATVVEPLRADLQRAQGLIADSKGLDKTLRAKMKFLELTAVMQFQAMVLGEPLYASHNRFFDFSYEELIQSYREYARHLRKITESGDKSGPIAELLPMRHGPTLVAFRHDSTQWVVPREALKHLQEM